MAEIKVEVRRIIDAYRKELERSGIRCSAVYLFGSYAKGEEKEGSDIDLIVVSPDWEGKARLERLEILGVSAARILEPIQALGFSPEEVGNHNLPPFWDRVLETEAIPA